MEEGNLDILVDCVSTGSVLWCHQFRLDGHSKCCLTLLSDVKVGINQNRTFYNLSRTNRHFRHITHASNFMRPRITHGIHLRNHLSKWSSFIPKLNHSAYTVQVLIDSYLHHVYVHAKDYFTKKQSTLPFRGIYVVWKETFICIYGKLLFPKQYVHPFFGGII
jgi:hypothetical protein